MYISHNVPYVLSSVRSR